MSIKPFPGFNESVRLLINFEGRPSVDRAKELLKLKLLEAKPKPFIAHLPVFVNVTYYLGADVVTLSGKGRTLAAWHVRNPGAAAMAGVCIDVLVRAKIITAGQVVCSNASKIVGEPHQNALMVGMGVLAHDAFKDVPTRKQKLLTWFVAHAKKGGRVPTKRAYFSLLRSLTSDDVGVYQDPGLTEADIAQVKEHLSQD